MAVNKTNSLQNLVLMWRLHDYSCYSYIMPVHHLDAMQCMLHVSRCSPSYLKRMVTLRQGGSLRTDIVQFFK